MNRASADEPPPSEERAAELLQQFESSRTTGPALGIVVGAWFFTFGTLSLVLGI